jgi:phytoene dehydrogenase-like protein
MSNRERSDVVVIGAGLAGLIAAADLARRGRSVVVVEKSKQLGGRAITQEEEAGYLWTLGPHALYRRGAAKRILDDLGVGLSGASPSGTGQLAFHKGRLHTLPSGFVSLVSTGLLPLGAKLEFARLLGAIGRIDPEPLRHVTVAQWLAQSIKHEAVAGFLGALVRLTSYANAPDAMSAGDAVEQIQLGLAGNVLYLDRGWQTLVDGLVEVGERAGVRFERAAGARSLDVADGALGVRLADGRTLSAGAVIAAVPPQSVTALFDGALPQELGRAIAGVAPIRAACLDLALAELPVANARFALGIDRPFYLSVHSAVAKLAPEGGAVVHVAKYLAPNDDGATNVERDLEQLMDLVQRGWRDRVVARRFLPAMTVAHALPAAAVGGIAGRPKPDATGVAGLFLAGDWVGETGMLADAAAASARTAAERCHAYLDVRHAQAA